MTAYPEQMVAELARRTYYERCVPFDVDAERAAMVVIDLQWEFVEPEATPFWVPEATRRLPRVAAFLGSCRAAGLPVIHTAFARTHELLDRPRSGASMPNRYHEAGDDPSWFADARFDAAVAPQPGEPVIRKPSYGAFYDTPLQTILHNLRRDTLLLAGTLTNFCVGTTARQGYERGFDVVVLEDLCATDHPALHDAELATLRKGFARIATAAEIASELDGARAGHR